MPASSALRYRAWRLLLKTRLTRRTEKPRSRSSIFGDVASLSMVHRHGDQTPSHRRLRPSLPPINCLRCLRQTRATPSRTSTLRCGRRTPIVFANGRTACETTLAVMATCTLLSFWEWPASQNGRLRGMSSLLQRSCQISRRQKRSGPSELMCGIATEPVARVAVIAPSGSRQNAQPRHRALAPLLHRHRTSSRRSLRITHENEYSIMQWRGRTGYEFETRGMLAHALRVTRRLVG